MLTFQDIFKSDFLSSVDSISLVDIALALVLSFALGLFIFFVYKKTYMGVMYSSSFGVTLVALTMITTVVILAVTSNVVLSLGMVRFRAAIKEPLEIAFLFWSIAVGIVLAAGLIVLAVLGSAVIGLILIVFVNRRSWLDPYIVVLHCDGEESEREATNFLTGSVSKCSVKSKTVRPDGVELNVEVRMKGESTGFVNALAAIPGVQSAVLVSYNGEYMG